jgi:hypothetical protein
MATTATTPSPAQTPATASTPTAGKSDAKPAAAFRFGKMSAAVFPQPGNASPIISLRRSYKTAEGTWDHMHGMYAEDLPTAILALEKCFEHLMSRKGD